MAEVNETPSCNYCTSACCRKFITHRLTPAEAAFLEEGGTVLKVLVKPEEAASAAAYEGSDPELLRQKDFAKYIVPPTAQPGYEEGFGGYITQTDCGYLDVDPETGIGTCKVYVDPRRPKSCADFPVDSEGCRNIRESASLPRRPLPVPVSILPKPPEA